MTNAEIIFVESQRLAKEGKISYTGRVFEGVDGEGKPVQIQETEAIHTYNAWKELGYQVQKGQKAVAQFVIWKYKKGKAEVEADGLVEAKGTMFMKKASFFTKAQVQAI